MSKSLVSRVRASWTKLSRRQKIYLFIFGIFGVLVFLSVPEEVYPVFGFLFVISYWLSKIREMEVEKRPIQMVVYYWVLAGFFWPILPFILAVDTKILGFNPTLLVIGASPWISGFCIGAGVWEIAMMVVKRNFPNSDTHKKCSECKEWVLKDANVCKHCGAKFDELH